MIEEKIHLTFKAKKSTSEKLKLCAHAMNMTQPELINEICEDFIKLIEQAAEELQNECKTENQTNE